MSNFPDIEKYGREASFSFLADLLELEALQLPSGYSRSIYDLADFIRDAGLTTKLGQLWEEEVTSSIREHEDDLSLTKELELARRVFDFAEERIRLLKDKYPFVIRNQAVCLAEPVCNEDTHNYLCLLDITLSHAFGETTFDGANPRDRFEFLCVGVFSDAGYRSSGMMSQIGASDFESRLAAAGQKLGSVEFQSCRTIKRKKQQDAKADLLAIHDLGTDDRPARHLWVGQATCAKSGEWDRKRNEVSCNRWQLLSGNKLSPISLLMIPHHADPTHLAELAQDQTPPIFDRLRLCFIAKSRFTSSKTIHGFERFEINGWGQER